MTSKFNMSTATVTDLVNTLGVQRTIANAIDSAKPKSLDELLAVRGMSQEIIDELDSSVEIIYYEDSRNDAPLKPESKPALISPTHDHLLLAADSTERMLRHLLDRQDEASRQQEEWRRYVDQRQSETNQVLLEMLGKLTGSVAEPPAGPPTVVNPVITEASDEEGKGTLSIGKNSSEKVRLGGELRDYVPDDNLAQRHTGNVRDEINVDIAQTADTYPHSIMNSPSSSQQQEFTSMPKLQNVYDTRVVNGVYQPNMSQSKNIIQNGLDLSGIQHADGQVIVDGVIRRPSIATGQNPANRQSRQNSANMPTRQIPANMPICKNVPRQADRYCEDDQVNDYHEYPQSHVRPPKALGPKPANMSPQPNNSKYPGEAYTYAQGRHVDIHGEIESHNDHYGPPNHCVRPSKAPGPNPANMPLYSNVHKYPGDVHTYAQGHQADTHGKVEPRSNHFDPSNPHVRPSVSSDPNPTYMLYTQNDAQLEDTFVNIAQQMVSLNLYEQCSLYKVSDCTQQPLVPPSMDNLDSHVTSSSDTEQLEHDVPQWHDMFEHIPSFDGNDWHAFITVFERHLHRRNPPSPLRLDLLEMKLSGETFQAYGTSASYISTYEELRDFLQARFGCRVTAQIRRTELFNMKQKSDETLVDYASRIKFVAGEGYPDTSNRQRSELEIAAFLQGCRDKTLAERVMQNSHEDLDSALNAMVRVVQNALMFKSHDPKQSKAVRFLRPADDHSHQTSAQIDTDDEFRDFEEYQCTPYNECPPGIIGNKDVDHPFPSLNY